MMRTCQILAPDDYLGVLEPWVHYLPLAEDLGNIDEVREAMADDDLVGAVVDAAYEVLIASGDFDYSSFVRDMFETDIAPFVDPDRPRRDLSGYRAEVGRLRTLQMATPSAMLETLQWVLGHAAVRGALRSLRNAAVFMDELASTNRALCEIADHRVMLVATGVTPFADPRLDPIAVEVLRYLALHGLISDYLHWIDDAIDGRLTIDTLRPWTCLEALL
jgi:hypothetical protein